MKPHALASAHQTARRTYPRSPLADHAERREANLQADAFIAGAAWQDRHALTREQLLNTLYDDGWDHEIGETNARAIADLVGILIDTPATDRDPRPSRSRNCATCDTHGPTMPTLAGAILDLERAGHDLKLALRSTRKGKTP